MCWHFAQPEEGEMGGQQGVMRSLPRPQARHNTELGSLSWKQTLLVKRERKWFLLSKPDNVILCHLNIIDMVAHVSLIVSKT